MNIIVRQETENDYSEITKVNDLAFGQPGEGLLVESLRLNTDFIKDLSLVAEIDKKVIGHILFFPIKIEKGETTHDSLALAPMSVLPEFQKKGIGSKLVTEGLKIAKELSHESVIVLGHENYYPKFGFVPASKWGIKSPFEVPDEVFLALELKEDGLKNVSGIVKYPKEFDEVS